MDKKIMVIGVFMLVVISSVMFVIANNPNPNPQPPTQQEIIQSSKQLIQRQEAIQNSDIRLKQLNHVYSTPEEPAPMMMRMMQDNRVTYTRNDGTEVSVYSERLRRIME